MTLTQMQYLIAIVDHDFNISRAALALHTSQPGISRQIRILERELGTVILARDAGRIVGATDSGLLVIARARRVIHEANSLAAMKQEFMQLTSGRLSIGSLHTYALSLLPKAVASLRENYPEVVVEVRNTAPKQSIELLRSGHIELAITIGMPPASSGLLGLPLVNIPPVLVVPAGHPLLKLASIQLDDLARYPMICHESLSSTTWGMIETFKRQGIEIRAAVYACDASVMRAYVAEGVGIAVVSGHLPNAKNLEEVDVSYLFDASAITAVLDPQRFHSGYFYDFIGFLAPTWTRRNIDASIRRSVVHPRTNL